MRGMVIRAMASMPSSERSSPEIAPRFASVAGSPAPAARIRIASPMTTTGIPRSRAIFDTSPFPLAGIPTIPMTFIRIYSIVSQDLPYYVIFRNSGPCRGSGRLYTGCDRSQQIILLSFCASDDIMVGLTRIIPAPGRNRPRRPPWSVSRPGGRVALLRSRSPAGSGGQSPG